MPSNALFALTAAAFSLTAPALAQAPAAPVDAPMAGVEGYRHPNITADDCKVIDAGRTECVIPARSAGRYVVEAAGTSTANGDGATQTLSIGGPNWRCGEATNKAVWSTGPRTFRLECLINVLTDEPLAVDVVYGDTNATKDPNGPVLTLHRVSWNGVLDYRIIGYQ